MSQKYNRLDYCQYLLSSQVNYTITNLAEHLETVSHDRINRYLRGEKLQPNLLWKDVKNLIELDPEGVIVFDDTVLNKKHSSKIELVKKQYSGNEKKVIKGIGVVNCVYVNRKTGNFWIIDYRIYAPNEDGLSKLDHVKNMVKLSKTVTSPARLQNRACDFHRTRLLSCTSQGHPVFDN